MINHLKISDTTLRDGHQSLMSTRMTTEDMELIANDMDEIGFYSIEAWGGATFDVCTRYLIEDPWERLKKLKLLITKTPLSMLLRGQSLVGYRAYADDVVNSFIGRCSYNGIDIFRIFDALNDEWNLECAANAVKQENKHLQLTLCYSLAESNSMNNSIFNLDYYLAKAKQFHEMGADSICVKDMAGLLSPYDAYELIGALKQTVSIPIQLHTHYTSGMASMTALKSIEAGLDILDTALSPLALRSSQPAIEPILVSLRDSKRDTNINLESILKLDAQLEIILKKYSEYFYPLKSSVIDPKVLEHQIPGGMISNLVAQLKEADALDKLDEVLADIPNTRKDLGYPPLVTPMSQMVGSQSLNNILFGRYEMISDQIKDYCRGMYGRSPIKINQNLINKAFPGNSYDPVASPPNKNLPNEMGSAKEEIRFLTSEIDEILIYALYPTTGMSYLRIKHGLDPQPTLKMTDTSQNFKEISPVTPTHESNAVKSSNAKKFNVYINGEQYEVEVDPIGGNITHISDIKNKSSVNTHNIPSSKQNTEPTKPTFIKPSAQSNDATNLLAPMPGILINYVVAIGDKVKSGDPICILETMKMQNTLPSPCEGTIEDLPFIDGSQIIKGNIIAVIRS